MQGMPMIEVGIEVDSAAMRAGLARLKKGLGNLQPVMESIGQEIESRISGRFETEKDPDGEAWAPWAESTRENYPQDGHGRILDRYADMMRSLNFKADPNSVRIGFGAVASKNRDVYAVYHEFGTRTMPRRGLLTSDPEEGTLGAADERSVLDLLDDWLSDLVDKA